MVLPCILKLGDSDIHHQYCLVFSRESSHMVPLLAHVLNLVVRWFLVSYPSIHSYEAEQLSV